MILEYNANVNHSTENAIPVMQLRNLTIIKLEIDECSIFSVTYKRILFNIIAILTPALGDDPPLTD